MEGGALKTLNCLYNSLTSKLKIMLNDLDGNIHIIWLKTVACYLPLT